MPAYIKSEPYSPKVNWGVTKAQAAAKEAEPPEPTTMKKEKPPSGLNQIFNTLHESQWLEDRPAPIASKRRLKDCTPDERRVLEVRCYHERHIYRRGDIEVSARLDIATEDLNDLWEPTLTLLPVPTFQPDSDV
jgi:hypothetical protein